MTQKGRHAAARSRTDVRVPIADDWDIPVLRGIARRIARDAGLRESAVEALATAISEIARNIIVHAGQGEVLLEMADDGDRRGVLVVARDKGPGIEDPDQAMQDGYSTANSLGLGLSSAKRLVDEFEIASSPGQGTTITMKKWAT